MFAKIFALEMDRKPTADDLRPTELAKNPTPENIAELIEILRKQAAENGVTGVAPKN